MRLVSALFASALCSLPATALAGTYIEESSAISAGGQNQSATIRTWVEADMVRTDDPRSGLIMLLNMKKPSVTGVQPSQKTWWQLPPAAVAEFGQSTLIAYGIKRGPDGQVVVPAKLFERTGQKKPLKIRVPAGGGKDKEIEVVAEEVKVNIDLSGMNANPQMQAQMQGFKSVMWVANVPGYDPAIQRNRTLMWIGSGPESDAFVKQWESLGGVPVITEMTLPSPQGMVTMTTTLQKVAPQKMRPEDLSVPKAFTQVEDPLTKMKRDQRGAGGAGGQAPPPMGQ